MSNEQPPKQELPSEEEMKLKRAHYEHMLAMSAMAEEIHFEEHESMPVKDSEDIHDLARIGDTLDAQNREIRRQKQAKELKRVRDNLKGHQEAMYTTALEANNIENAPSLKEHVENVEKAEKEHKETVKNAAAEDASNQKKQQGEGSSEGKKETVAKKLLRATRLTGGFAAATAAGAGSALWATGFAASQLGFSPAVATAAGVNLGWVGPVAGAAFFDYLAWQLFKSLREDWRSLVNDFTGWMGGKLGPGAPRRPSGGGGGGGGGAAHH